MPTSASSESAVPGRSQLVPCFPWPRAMSRKNQRCKTIGLAGFQALALQTKFLTQGTGAPLDRPLGRRGPSCANAAGSLSTWPAGRSLPVAGASRPSGAADGRCATGLCQWPPRPLLGGLSAPDGPLCQGPWRVTGLSPRWRNARTVGGHRNLNVPVTRRSEFGLGKSKPTPGASASATPEARAFICII